MKLKMGEITPSQQQRRNVSEWLVRILQYKSHLWNIVIMEDNNNAHLTQVSSIVYVNWMTDGASLAWSKRSMTRVR